MARPVLPCHRCGGYRAYNAEQFQGTRFHCGDCNALLDKEGTSSEAYWLIYVIGAFLFAGACAWAYVAYF